MNFPFVKYYKFHYFFVGVLILAGLFFILKFGINLNIDFTGGSILEVSFEKRPENPAIQEKLKDLNLGEIFIQPSEENNVIIKLKSIDEPIHQQIISRLSEISKIEEKRFESIGPAIGKELREKTVSLITFSLIALLIYIVVAFRKLKWPIAGWQYGLVSIIALTIDIFIPFAALAVLGKVSGVQLSIPIVAALLTILGYTINDKVIVFDRVRENLLQTRSDDFAESVNQSLNQIIGRSLGTGFCTLLVLFFIFFFGGETLRYFALTLIIGIIVGTYTSLFIASSLLVSWSRRKE